VVSTAVVNCTLLFVTPAPVLGERPPAVWAHCFFLGEGPPAVWAHCFFLEPGNLWVNCVGLEVQAKQNAVV